MVTQKQSVAILIILNLVYRIKRFIFLRSQRSKLSFGFRLHYAKKHKYGSLSGEQSYSNTYMVNSFAFNFLIRLIIIIALQEKKDVNEEMCDETILAKVFV